MGPLAHHLRDAIVFAVLLLLPGLVHSKGLLSEPIESCAAVECDSAGDQTFPDGFFQDRLESAFGSCGDLDLVPQQCHACASAIYTDTPETDTGKRCVTSSHFKTAIDFCLAVVKEYDPPVDTVLDPELKDVTIPPTSVSQVPLTEDSRRILEPQSIGVQRSALQNDTERLSAAACSVKWITKSGYMIYPVCAKLVCGMYGNPTFYANKVENCCKERSHHLGGSSWKTNCWYYAT